MPKQIVLVGGGLASVAAIETLRGEGYDGGIRLISEEAELPYDRPPLSKSFLSGQVALPNILLHDEAWYREQRVDLELGQRVTEINLAQQRVVTDGELSISYDKLLIAVGARARAFSGAPSSAGARLRYLRTLGDVEHIKAIVGKGSHVVLIGGGVIGMETAATLLHLGCQVTVLEAADRIMGRCFPAPLSQIVQKLHAEHGCEVRTEVVIAKIESSANGVVIHLGDGAALNADCLVVGIGIVPNSELAAQVGLSIRLQGIEVDMHAQTAAAGVYAAGDVATFPLSDGVWARWENWTHARMQAATAAKHMVGKGTAGYAEIPWIWSDQYEFNIQVTGSAVADDVVFRGGLDAGRLTAFHLQRGRIVGATTINDSRNKSSIRKLIECVAEVPAAQLSDLSVDLKKLAAIISGKQPA